MVHQKSVGDNFSNEPGLDELLDTDWDTEPQEIAFLGAAIEYYGPTGKNPQGLMRLLASGIDETWFINDNRKYIYLGVFNCATLIDQPNITVRIGAIVNEAEKLSGESNWALDEISNIMSKLSIFNLDEFIEEDIPLWWNKLKKPKMVNGLSRLNMTLCHLPPNTERLQEIDRLSANLVDLWRAEPNTTKSDDTWLSDLRDKCLEPIPVNYRVPTGIEIIDNTLNGGIGGPSSPDSGRLIIVCARPGMGKTMVAANVAVLVARQNYKVGFWSFEMSRAQVGLRIIANVDYRVCRQSGGLPVTYANLKNRIYPDPDQKDRLKGQIYSDIQSNTKIITGDSTMTAEYVCNQMKTFAIRHPDTRLFVIDHLGLLNISDKNRATAVGEATRQIKTTATALNIDIMLLCQLNRALEIRDDKRPTLSDLRDSGRIEEDADIVIGVHRPAYYDPEDPSLDNICEIISLKNRQGQSGNISTCAAYFDHCTLMDFGSPS